MHAIARCSVAIKPTQVNHSLGLAPLLWLPPQQIAAHG